MTDQTTLYRHFNATGELLYVGISINAFERYKQHAKDKAWINEISSTTYEPCETREIALLAEKLAIKREKPIHNIVHNNISTIHNSYENEVPLSLEDIKYKCKANGQLFYRNIETVNIDPEENWYYGGGHFYKSYFLNKKTHNMVIHASVVMEIDLNTNDLYDVDSHTLYINDPNGQDRVFTFLTDLCPRRNLRLSLRAVRHPMGEVINFTVDNQYRFDHFSDINAKNSPWIGVSERELNEYGWKHHPSAREGKGAWIYDGKIKQMQE